jgi:hypothetical protein
MRVKLGRGIAEVVQLDEPTLHPGLTVHWDVGGREYIAVEGDRAALERLREACSMRQQSGWDQPLWYASSARAAERALIRSIREERT